MKEVRHFSYDRSRPLAYQPHTGHNRWHPDIAPIASVKPGEIVSIECPDGGDGQIGRASSHADVAVQEFGRAHPLRGPFYVEGAEPGDLLGIEVLDIEAPDWGFTAVMPGFGFLHDEFPDPYLVIWEINDERARTPALPGVAIPACMHPGVMGVAPSHQELERIRKREASLAARGGTVAPDESASAVPPDAADGLRTLPPREGGGNIDVRQLGPGARLLLPVSVEGALFSIGDVHFSQGDGEVCGFAIEISAVVTLRFVLQSNSVWAPPTPAYLVPPGNQPGCFATTGISVAGESNESFDLTLASRNALLTMIDWLVVTQGFTREAAYVLCSTVVDLRLSEVVDGPNPLASAVIPLDIFENERIEGLLPQPRAEL